MSKRVVELFLFDTLIAILKIEQTVERFENSQTLLYDFNAWDSVVREFEIIGEATKILIEKNILLDKHRVIVDFRNLLIHNYFGIDADEVWNVVEDDLPQFKIDILNRIDKVDKSLKNELVKSYIETNKHLNFIVSFLESL